MLTMDNQQAAFEKLSRLKVGALFMEMGTGKTKIALDLIASKAHKVGYVLWICPFSIKSEIERLQAKLAEYKKPIDKFIKDRERQAVKGFAEKLKKDTMVTYKYDDGTILYTTSNKLIDQLVNIFLKEYEK